MHSPFFWSIFPVGVLAWVAVVVLVVMLLMRRDHRYEPTHSGTPPALTLLEERYARGEVSREEFFQRRAVLLGPTSGTPPNPAPQAPQAPPQSPSGPPPGTAAPSWPQEPPIQEPPPPEAGPPDASGEPTAPL